MIEHRIQNHSDSRLMRSFHKFQKVFVRAELGIDLKIILGIVLVGAVCFEERSKVNAGNSQFFQIRNFFGYALKGTAEKLVVCDSFGNRTKRQKTFPGLRSRIKTVGENFIPNRIFHPARSDINVFFVDIRIIVVVEKVEN